MAQGLVDRLEAIRQRVAGAASTRTGELGRTSVTLIAVSKTQPWESIRELYEQGQRDFGENYVQELVEKAAQARHEGLDEIRWHFLGNLQTNKCKSLVTAADFVHSVDSIRLARELAARWEAAGRAGKLPIFLEINIDREHSKHGFTPADAPVMARTIQGSFAPLALQGLMCIPSAKISGKTGLSHAAEEKIAHPPEISAFTRMRELEAHCRPHTQGALSMGMTQDFEEAIAQGATHVRVGTAIFGARAPKTSPL